MLDCTHKWVADNFHSGFGCSHCFCSYWDWSQAEIKALTAHQHHILVALKHLQDDLSKLERIVS